MAFEKGFDELLNDILTDYVNQFPEADTSQGSLIFIKSACLASALWGLYKYQGWISRQIFPDQADAEYLEHHAWIRGLTRTAGETDAELLTRLLDYIRRPPAGGNKYDYVKWALEVDAVAAAWCIPLGQGLGSTDVVILADAATTGSEIPTQTLLDTVRAHIEDIRPNDVKYLRVLAPTVVTVAVTMTMTGANADPVSAAAEIAAYLSALTPGQSLFTAQLINIALEAGADDVTLPAPAANVTATAYQMIRPGVINVT